MIKRSITNQLIEDIRPGNVTVLFGARRTGKTFLMNHIRSCLPDKKVLLLNGEDYDVASILSSGKQELLKSLVSGYEYLFLDEAQSIPNIGQNLKLMVDSQPDVGVFVTGSAAFDLRNKIGEPLTGRSRFFHLYPLNIDETADNFIEALQTLPISLVYGSYPQVVVEKNFKQKMPILESIRNGYLLKDILQLDNLKDSLFVMNLLRLLALQIGNDISYNEIAQNLSTTVKTVQRYLEILEKTFIVFRLHGFSRNLRKEISKSPRIYFWDNGIRNIIISNLNPLEIRDDAGRLWENFCISERVKIQKYRQTFSNFYFWRTYDGQEIDLVEEFSGKLMAFEMKWGEKTVTPPKVFIQNYPHAIFNTINRRNFFDKLRK